MAASPQIVDSNPLYLNARSGIYTAQELRQPLEESGPGPGVCDYLSFKVVQRAAGANMSVDVGAAGVLNRAYVRGSTVADQGLYRVDFTGASNLDIAAADPTNPRIDQIYLAVEDQQHAGANNQATVRVVTGTATGGATLDNRTGVGAAPAGMGSILLADVLVAALDTSIINAEIRDRRPFGVLGQAPPLMGVVVEQCALIPPFLSQSVGSQATAGAANADTKQSAVLHYLPRRMVSAARFRWRYQQTATPATSNWVMFLADASGRVVAQTAAIAFTGAAGAYVEVSAAFLASITLEVGYYYMGIGIATMTASSQVFYNGTAMNLFTSGANNVHGVRNTFLRSASGGTTVPATILGYTDIITMAAAGDNAPSVPAAAISV